MSYARSKEEAVSAIKSVEPDNEANMSSSPVLNGASSGGPAGKGELVPKNFTLGSHTTEFKRTL
jgi:hypothetical protein